MEYGVNETICETVTVKECENVTETVCVHTPVEECNIEEVIVERPFTTKECSRTTVPACIIVPEVNRHNVFRWSI